MTETDRNYLKNFHCEEDCIGCIHYNQEEEYCEIYQAQADMDDIDNEKEEG